MFALICSYFLVYRYTGETKNRELRQSRISVSTPAVPPNSSLLGFDSHTHLCFSAIIKAFPAVTSSPSATGLYSLSLALKVLTGTAIIVLKIEEVLRGQGPKKSRRERGV